MATDIDKKRNKLLKAYSGDAWHEQVAHMPREQVIAIYLRFERDGWPNKKLKPEEPKSKDEPNDEQMPLF